VINNISSLSAVKVLTIIPSRTEPLPIREGARLTMCNDEGVEMLIYPDSVYMMSNVDLLFSFKNDKI
jgi:hypothetical protein